MNQKPNKTLLWINGSDPIQLN